MRSAIFGMVVVMAGMVAALVIVGGPSEHATTRVFVPEAATATTTVKDLVPLTQVSAK